MENTKLENAIIKNFEINSQNTGWKLTCQEIENILKDPQKGNLGPEVDMNPRNIAKALKKLGLGDSIVMRRGTIVLRGYIGIIPKSKNVTV